MTTKPTAEETVVAIYHALKENASDAELEGIVEQTIKQNVRAAEAAARAAEAALEDEE